MAMTFFEKELKKLVDQGLPLTDTAFVGRACYGKIEGNLRARMEFVSPKYANQYSAIKVTIFNKKEGPIDSVLLRFSDVLGIKKVENLNFKDGLVPYIWANGGKTEWYVYKPKEADYKLLTKEVGSYMALFAEEEMNQTSVLKEMSL